MYACMYMCVYVFMCVYVYVCVCVCNARVYHRNDKEMENYNLNNYDKTIANMNNDNDSLITA